MAAPGGGGRQSARIQAQRQPRMFYHPDCIFQSSNPQKQLVQADTPAQTLHGYRLPFADPPRLNTDQFPQDLQCKQLVCSPLSSTKRSTTKPAPAVQNLDAGDRLVHLRLSLDLVPNLIRYAGGGIPLPATHRRAPSLTQSIDTWATARQAHADLVTTLELPSEEQRARAAFGMAAWCARHAAPPQVAVVNCEVAFYDEIQSQLLESMNFFLQVTPAATVLAFGWLTDRLLDRCVIRIRFPRLLGRAGETTINKN